MKIRKLITIIILTVLLGAAVSLGALFSSAQIEGESILGNLISQQISNNTQDEKSTDSESESEQDKSQAQVIFTNNNDVEVAFDVEVADTPTEREVGLMHRESLPKDTGMLFIYPNEARRSFWMKNTLIPLDLIHINNGEIVEIIEDMQPCGEQKSMLNQCKNYISTSPSKYSLEVNAGVVDRYDLSPGNQVELNLPD